VLCVKVKRLQGMR